MLTTICSRSEQINPRRKNILQKNTWNNPRSAHRHTAARQYGSSIFVLVVSNPVSNFTLQLVHLKELVFIIRNHRLTHSRTSLSNIHRVNDVYFKNLYIFSVDIHWSFDLKLCVFKSPAVLNLMIIYCPFCFFLYFCTLILCTAMVIFYVGKIGPFSLSILLASQLLLLHA